jgi:hypothetical protein
VNVDRLNKWLTLLANFGVVAGIVFLAIEVRQNQALLEESNRINRFESRMSAVDTFNEWRGQWVQDEELTRIWISGLDGNPLEPIDQARFENLCTSDFWIHLKIHEWSMTTGDYRTTDGHMELVISQLQNKPGWMRCWEIVKPAMTMYGASTFVNSIENGLK